MDKIDAARRSANMARIRSKDTKPEMVVRRIVHGLGYRYRLHQKDLPGKPDLVFGPRKAVIFVHGCFWHCHPDPACKDARLPKSRLNYWLPKLEKNVARDAAATAALESMGWRTLTIWDCDTKNIELLRETIKSFLSPPIHM